MSRFALGPSRAPTYKEMHKNTKYKVAAHDLTIPHYRPFARPAVKFGGKKVFQGQRWSYLVLLLLLQVLQRSPVLVREHLPNTLCFPHFIQPKLANKP